MLKELGICVVCGKSTKYITIVNDKLVFVCKLGCEVPDVKE